MTHFAVFLARLVTTVLAIPFLVILGLTLLINDAVYSLISVRRQKPELSKEASSIELPVEKITTSIVIPTWNGRELLAECLPSVVEAVAEAKGGHEIIVVDNGSADGSVAFLEENFPTVRVLALDKNYYFTGGCNRGALMAQNEIVLFLNNDMKVEKGFIEPLLAPFAGDGSIFAVSSQIFFEDSSRPREETGKTRARWRSGAIWPAHDQVTKADLEMAYSPAFWFGGGSAAVDRKKFLALGGFDELYSPFYVEDFDISYQAWKRGWQNLFCPASRVIHKHRATSRRFGDAFIERTVVRNELLFIWSNITDIRFTLSHIINLPGIFGRMMSRIGGRRSAQTLIAALIRTPACMSRRSQRRRQARITDSDVFQIANSPFVHKQRYIPSRKVDAGEPLRILLITPYLPSLLHAGGGRMLQLIRRLARKHSVSLLSFSDNDRELAFLPELRGLCKSVEVISRQPRVTQQDPLHLIPGRMLEEFSDPAMSLKIEQALLADNFDIVQCEYLQMAYVCPHLSRESTMLTDHEVQHLAYRTNMRRLGPLKSLLTFPAWLKWLSAEIDACRRFDQVVTVTDRDALALRRFSSSLDVRTLETAVDDVYFQPEHSIEEEPNSLVYVGGFRHKPNVDAVNFFVEAVLPLVRRELPDVKFYVVGSYGRSEIPNSVQSTPNVFVTDWVDDLRPYLAKSSLAVVPVRLGAGIRGKVLEAWAMGKAVVSTSLGCAGLDARQGENLWIADKAADFADSVVTLLRNDELRRALGEDGRQTVERLYGYDMFMKKHEEAYYSLLSKKGNHSNAGMTM
jgi:O-antigen biosynthesis protein